MSELDDDGKIHTIKYMDHWNGETQCGLEIEGRNYVNKKPPLSNFVDRITCEICLKYGEIRPTNEQIAKSLEKTANWLGKYYLDNPEKNGNEVIARYIKWAQEYRDGTRNIKDEDG